VGVMGVGATLGAAGRVLEGARGVARVFRVDASQRVELDHAAHQATLAQFQSEFGHSKGGFDRVMDGVNRLPRPFLAFGTFAMFAYAMGDPIGFSARMQGLAYVPEPLWWLLGAIVGFYFGARELHYLRVPHPQVPAEAKVSGWHHSDAAEGAAADAEAGDETGGNPALSAWKTG